jgi:hypothetical protein
MSVGLDEADTKAQEFGRNWRVPFGQEPAVMPGIRIDSR